MKRLVYAVAVVGAIAVPVAFQTRLFGQTPPAKPADPNAALVSTYCVGCHSARLKTGGLSLEGLNPQMAVNDADVWEKVLRKLRGHQMPPPGSPQPMLKDVEAFTASMENTLDTR